MKSILLLMIVLVLVGGLGGCLSVNAPEKVEVQANTGNPKWNRTANRYASYYAGSSKSRQNCQDDDDDDEEDDD
ncbi:MAG: hypothetical protein JXA11_09655 [Phycisphaerae bacterium]|nr:hypothetical protein [Phycisphaerae bacterium]